ncbi:MAG: hypothetical protein ABIH23_19720 [bacterium]
MTSPSRIISACPSCDTKLPAPVELWRDGVCRLSRSFCGRCHKTYEHELYRLGCEIEDEGLRRLQLEQISGYWAGKGCDEWEPYDENSKEAFEYEL